jgi:hypothetical protein
MRGLGLSDRKRRLSREFATGGAPWDHVIRGCRTQACNEAHHKFCGLTGPGRCGWSLGRMDRTLAPGPWPSTPPQPAVDFPASQPFNPRSWLARRLDRLTSGPATFPKATWPTTLIGLRAKTRVGSMRSRIWNVPLGSTAVGYHQRPTPRSG